MTRLTIRRSQIWKEGLENWSDLALGTHALVVSEATKECFELATSTQPSVKTTGGTYVEGFVPEDTGRLIESQRVTVNGQTVSTGRGSADAVPARITQRTNVSLWFDATNARGQEYGRWVENGTKFMRGRFFVRNAKQKWRSIVDAVAARHSIR